MAIVPRWCIIATTLKDTVASHTFFVTIYSYLIAETIGWKGPRDYLMMNALMHDNDETISSDITGPYKSVIMTEDAQQALYEKSLERMGGLMQAYESLEDNCSNEEINEATAIVAAADKLDALLFLVLNSRMGNTLVKPAIAGGLASLEGAWRRLPAPKEVVDKTWQTVVLPAIDDHYERGARGCAPGVNI